jgi:hypothetical protein
VRDPYFEFQQALTLVLIDDKDADKRRSYRSKLRDANENVNKHDLRYSEAVHRALAALSHREGSDCMILEQHR